MSSDENISQLKFYSIGIVLKDNLEGGDYIEVSPTEHLNLSEGNVKNNITEIKAKISDNIGVTRSSKTVSTEKIVAKWLSFTPNRINAPCVYEGETVILFQFADSEEKHWTTIFREPILRRKEFLLIACSNEPNKGKEFSKENSYWVEINTIDKFVKLHTAKNDGEAVGYDVEFNTSTGYFKLTDTAGNIINLESTDGILELESSIIKLKARTSLEFDTPVIITKGNIESTGHMNIAGGIDSPSNINAPNID